jgi:hypothetical protein
MAFLFVVNKFFKLPTRRVIKIAKNSYFCTLNEPSVLFSFKKRLINELEMTKNSYFLLLTFNG